MTSFHPPWFWKHSIIPSLHLPNLICAETLVSFFPHNQSAGRGVIYFVPRQWCESDHAPLMEVKEEFSEKGISNNTYESTKIELGEI